MLWYKKVDIKCVSIIIYCSRRGNGEMEELTTRLQIQPNKRQFWAKKIRITEHPAVIYLEQILHIDLVFLFWTLNM